jgi:hypothetical protein
MMISFNKIGGVASFIKNVILSFKTSDAILNHIHIFHNLLKIGIMILILNSTYSPSSHLNVLLPLAFLLLRRKPHNNILKSELWHARMTRRHVKLGAG